MPIFLLKNFTQRWRYKLLNWNIDMVSIKNKYINMNLTSNSFESRGAFQKLFYLCYKELIFKGALESLHLNSSLASPNSTLGVSHISKSWQGGKLCRWCELFNDAYSKQMDRIDNNMFMSFILLSIYQIFIIPASIAAALCVYSACSRIRSFSRSWNVLENLKIFF